ncbi:unnamed protein product [Cuscuta epithymum]|uniref:Gem-associated protein 2 n=1 Tax=Cuscuta epithymum TaxID=186058 RepID=A0AAV0CUY6_9ASTE|nr:unnamed protein product [Cuscuta epithymum]
MASDTEENLPSLHTLDDDNEEDRLLQMAISEAKQYSALDSGSTLQQDIAGNFENPVGGEEGMNKPSQNSNTSVVNVAAEDYQVRGKLTREELEAMRFLNVEEQRKKWIEVYCGLGLDVQKDYNGLLRSTNQKKNLVDFDPRRQLGKARGHVSFGQKESNENEDSFVVEEDTNYDDSDDDCISIQRPAFFVEGEPDFDSGPPEDGLEYLRRVRWEAERLPKVKVCKIERSKIKKEQSVYMPCIPDIATCPEHLLPLKEWEDEFLAYFSQLRLVLSQIEGPDVSICGPLFSFYVDQEQQSSHHLTKGITEDTDSTTSGDDHIQTNEGDKNALKNPCPTLSAISGMEPVARASLLRKRIAVFESTATASRDDCLWLFALCAAVDSPLDADTSAALRSLLRKCASLRAEKTMVDDEVIMLNLLATISGRYFGQAEK